MKAWHNHQKLLGAATLTRDLAISLKLDTYIPHNPAILLLDIYLKYMRTFPQNNLCKNVHSNFLSNLQLKNPKCPYMNMRKKDHLRHFHIIKCELAISKGNLVIHNLDKSQKKSCWVKEVTQKEHSIWCYIAEVNRKTILFWQKSEVGAKCGWWLMGRRYEGTFWDDVRCYNLIGVVFVGCIYTLIHWMTSLRCAFHNV